MNKTQTVEERLVKKLEELFPKGKCKERGQALVLFAFANIYFKEEIKANNESIKKQLNMTILFNEKNENDGDIVDWGSTLRAFIKQL